MLPCTRQPSYIKICYGYDHVPSCKAQNKTPSGRKSGKAKIGGEPIIYLDVAFGEELPEPNEEEGQPAQRKTNKNRDRANSRETAPHLKTTKQVARYVRENYHRRDEIVFREHKTKKELRFDEVIHDCSKVAKNPKLFEGKPIYVIGTIKKIVKHKQGLHFSLYFEVESEHLRLFLHYDNIPDSIDELINKLSLVKNRVILTYGTLEMYYLSPQVNLRSIDEMFIID